MKYSVTYPARGKLDMAAPLISTAGSGREHLPIIYFRMLHTVEHLPIPVSFPTFLVEVHFKRKTSKQKHYHRSGRVFQKRQFPKEGSFREQKHYGGCTVFIYDPLI